MVGTSALAVDLPEASLYEALASKHGHYCPMSTLGLRLGWAVRHLVDLEAVSLSYLSLTCAEDGLRLALGRDDIRMCQRDRHCLVIDGENSSFQVTISKRALSLAARYRNLDSDSAEALLESLRQAQVADLFHIEPYEAEK